MSVQVSVSLAALAKLANDEFALAQQAASKRAWPVLIAWEIATVPAKSQLPRGEWLDWLAENFDPALVPEIKRLHAAGLSYEKVGERLGLSKNQAWRYANPEAEKRRLAKARSQTIAGRREANRRKRSQEFKQRGGSLSEAYSLTRKAIQICDQARLETEKNAERRFLSDAINRLYDTEDALVRALKESRA